MLIVLFMCFRGIPYQNCRYRFENNRVVEDSSAEVDDLLVAHRRSSRGGGTKGSLDLSSKSSFRQLRERQVMTSPCYLCVAMRIIFCSVTFDFAGTDPNCLPSKVLLCNLLDMQWVLFLLWKDQSGLCILTQLVLIVAESTCSAVYGNRGCVKPGSTSQETE